MTRLLDCDVGKATVVVFDSANLVRRDVVDQRIAFANRRRAPGAETLAPFLEPLLACLTAQVERINAAIDTLVRDDDTLRRDAAVLRTMPGIGATTAAALLALMPELGRIDRRRIAALVGPASHPNQSGTREGAGRVKGGCPTIRHVLFMPALSAI